MTAGITIGFFPRERFAMAAESLQSLYEHTSLPFELMVVDPATPRRYWDAMQRVLDRHHNWRKLRWDRHLLPNESRNLVISEASSDYVCLLENDLLYHDGWLEPLLEACEAFSADVASPILLEGRGTVGHFDNHLGALVASDAHPGKWEVRPRTSPRHLIETRERVVFVEDHCLLFRRQVLDRIGPLDVELKTRTEVDLSLALHHAGATVVVEPRSRVHFMPPMGPLEDEELPFFRMRWDLAVGAASRDRIAQRWDLVETPGDLGFVRYRTLIPELPHVREFIAGLCTPGRRILVLEDGDWFDTDVLNGLPVLPFPERGGHFGGFPKSDEAAVAELRGVLASGITDVVVGWPADWWFDHLPRFRAELEGWARHTHKDHRLQHFSRRETQ